MKCNNLQKLRMIKNLKQKELSEYLGISLQAYCNKENGLRNFTLNEAKKISDLFQLTINDIFFNS